MKNFKPLFVVATLLCTILFFPNCRKDDTSANKKLANTPLAKAEFDSSNYGIYKGVFVGSSGIVMININNDGTISATITINGVEDHFTTKQSIEKNKPTNLSFIDFDKNIFDFTVDESGRGATISNLRMNGHINPAIIVVKETSKTLVQCFEGLYYTTPGSSGATPNGLFNAVFYDYHLYALIRTYDDSENYTAFGALLNGQFTTGAVMDQDVSFTGNIKGDKISGTWKSNNGAYSGSFSGDRTY